MTTYHRAKSRLSRLPEMMSDRWLSDVTLYGTAAQVREGIAAWQASGVRTITLVPVSADGGPLQAWKELLAAL